MSTIFSIKYSVTALYIAPESTKTKFNFLAICFASVDLPHDEKPSMAIIIEGCDDFFKICYKVTPKTKKSLNKKILRDSIYEFTIPIFGKSVFFFVKKKIIFPGVIGPNIFH